MEPGSRDVALVAVIALAPLAIVLIIALIRGYRIDISFRRNGDKKHGNGNGDDK